MTQKDCEHIEPYLMGFLDKELTEEDYGRVQSHLQTCSDCTALLGDYEKVGHLMRTTLGSEAQEVSFHQFGGVVQKRMRQETFSRKSERTWGFRRLLFPSGVVAGTVALAAAILLWINFGDLENNQTGPSLGILEVRKQEMERLQKELGLSIRDYAFLKYHLDDRHRAFEEALKRLHASASEYPDWGAYQEELGRTIRDYAFVFYRVRQLGEGEQEKIGANIRDLARLQFITRSEYL